MSALNSVINKSFVQRFYQAHLLAFLFTALVMFGMVDGNTLLQFHYALLIAAFSSPFSLLCLWLVLFLYAVNGLRYMLNTLAKPEFQFLFTSNAANRESLLKVLTGSVIQINAPILVYGSIGIGIGIYNGFYLNVVLGLLGFSALIIGPVAIIYRRLIYVHVSPLLGSIKLFPDFKPKPGLLSILLRHLTYENKTALIATKLFSCAVLYGAHYEWRSFNYDIRWMQVAMAISTPANGMLLYSAWTFENTRLAFTRNFPITVWRRYATILLLVFTLLIPELLLLTAYCLRFNILWQLPVYMLYASALQMLIYAMLYTRGFNQETLPAFLFAMGLATFFVTLFGFTWLLSLAFAPISFLVYKEAFYDFEPENK